MLRVALLVCGIAGCSPTDETPEVGSPADTADTATPPVTDTAAPPEPTEPLDTGTPPTDPIVACPPGTPGPSAGTTLGCMQGRLEDGVEGFLGIPYALPPVGALRWARSEPATPWADVRRSTEIGPACPQSNGSILGGDLAAGEGDEDCLTLNIMRPAGTTAGDDLPVLFFVHGGGHVDGSGTQPTYVGASFSQPEGDPPLLPDVPGLAQQAVLVTINYRLGPMGFLAHRGLTDADADGTSGNQGLWDALLALQWVHDNATALGGDPDRIAVFGESAGSVMTCNLVASSQPDGLIAAALLHSGTCIGLQHTLTDAGFGSVSGHQQGDDVAAALGCDTAGDDAAVVDCMRAASTEEVLRASPARLGLLGEGEVYGPVVDGVFLSEPPIDTYAAGTFEDLQLVIGVNDDEGTLFTQAAPITTDLALSLTLRAYAAGLGWNADALVALYDPARFGNDPSTAWNAFVGDANFICPARALAELTTQHVPTHTYWFTWSSPWVPWLGAAHGFELPFAFGTGLLFGDDAQLSDQMVDAWTSVAAGTPTAAGQPWPEFGGVSPDGGTWLHLDTQPIEAVTGVRKAECDWMATQGFMQP